jgi:hypothetical protein
MEENWMRGVSARDLETLRWVDEQYAVRVDQLARKLGRSERTMQRWARLYGEWGWIEQRRLLVDEPAYVWLTSKGQREAGTGFGPWRPKVGKLAHIAAVVDVRLYVEERSAESLWASERVLRRELAASEHLPDAVVTTEGERHAIEVELTPKARRRTVATIEELGRRYDRTLYFCAPAARRQIEELRRSHEWPRLAVRPLPEAAGEAVVRKAAA